MKIKTFLVSLAVVFAGFAASAQVQTNVITTASTVLPYFSVSNMVLTAGGTIAAADAIPAATTFSYLNATNANGAQIQPFAFPKARYVALGLSAYSTSGATGAVTQIIDAGTGAGDWVPIATNAVTLSGTTVQSASITIGPVGYVFGRLHSIQNADGSRTAYSTSGYSVQP
jgi:hypothetical protein